MQMRLLTGVELTHSQVQQDIAHCSAIADAGRQQQVIAALELSDIMLNELESLTKRGESGAPVEAGH